MYYYGIIFMFGGCMGSLIQVIMERHWIGESWIAGRSHCMNCRRILRGWMMIPIFSWFFLKGKCSYCKSLIPVRYIILEFLFGILALVFFLSEGGLGILKFLMFCILFLISYFDMKTMIIEPIWLFLLLIDVIVQLLMEWSLSEIIGGMVSVSGIMMMLNILLPNSFGAGDIQLMAICGALLGTKKIFVSWFIGNILAGIQAFYLLVKKKVNRKSRMPYAPALCGGIAVVLTVNMIFF